MKTEDGKQIFYGVPFWIVYIENHPVDIGTNQERKLYQPYQGIVHKGAKINVFGLKAFSTESAAQQWCETNKPKY